MTLAIDTAGDLLADLYAVGVSVRVAGDRLQAWPANRVTADLVHRLRTHKAEILARLANGDSPAAGDLPDRPPDRPGYVTEAVPDGDGWTWRQRREDSADRALAEHYASEAAGDRSPADPFGWMARRDPVTGETAVDRAERYRRECNGLTPGATRIGDGT